MSLTLNMVGGGGGSGGITATDAILRVQAPANSVVTIFKGGVSKSDNGHENADNNTIYEYFFIIHQSQFDSVNAWTVTATRGTDTNSKTIIVNTSDEHYVAIGYHVPSNIYQEVEYLESTDSNQYINTNAENTDGWDVDFQYTQQYTDNNGVYGVMGGRDSSNTHTTVIAYWRSNIYVVPPDTSVLAMNTNRHRAQWGKYYNWSIIVDGNVVTTSTTQNTYSQSLALFCEHGASGFDHYAKCRIYSAKFYQDQTCVREFYPCYRLSDSVAGMYDKVNGTFYTNAGGGTFVVGGDVS